MKSKSQINQISSIISFDINYNQEWIFQIIQPEWRTMNNMVSQ